MFIKGKKVGLRAMEPSDTDLLYHWENKMELWSSGQTLAPYSHFNIEQFVRYSSKDIYEAKQLRLMIKKVNENLTVGAIDLFEFDPFHLRAGVGVLINNPHRRKGYAMEALELLKQYAFHTLQLHQLFCSIREDNQESISLFKKSNFQITGKKEDWMWDGTNWKGELFMQLVNTK